MRFNAAPGILGAIQRIILGVPLAFAFHYVFMFLYELAFKLAPGVLPQAIVIVVVFGISVLNGFALARQELEWLSRKRL